MTRQCSGFDIVRSCREWLGQRIFGIRICQFLTNIQLQNAYNQTFVHYYSTPSMAPVGRFHPPCTWSLEGWGGESCGKLVGNKNFRLPLPQVGLESFPTAWPLHWLAAYVAFDLQVLGRIWSVVYIKFNLFVVINGGATALLSGPKPSSAFPNDRQASRFFSCLTLHHYITDEH